MRPNPVNLALLAALSVVFSLPSIAVAEPLDLRDQALAWANASRTERPALLESLTRQTTPGALIEALRTPPDYPPAPRTGRREARARVGEEGSAPYVAHIPAGYIVDRAWPLHIALHGGDTTGSFACDRNWRSRPEAMADVIMVCPTLEGARWWTPAGESVILATLAHMRRRYNVDTERVSVGGGSSGGKGAIHMATRYPWLFRATTPRAATCPYAPRELLNLAHVPTFLIHGELDSTIPVKHSRRSAATLRDAGIDFEYIEVEGLGHRFARHLNPTVADWLAPKARAHPDAFRYRVVRRGPPVEHIYWLRPRWPAGKLKGLELEARRDPANLAHADPVHTVTLDTTKPIDGVTIYLPDDGSFDPRLQTKLIYNGEEVWRGRVEASVGAVLGSWAEHRDVGLVSRWGVTVGLE